LNSKDINGIIIMETRRSMHYKKQIFRLSIAAAAAVWIFLSGSILYEVIESRKNTIAAGPTGYIQQDLKESIPIVEIISSEPLIIPKIFGLMLIYAVMFWAVTWGCLLVLFFIVRKFAGPKAGRSNRAIKENE
jgi:hypothetical protein